MGNRKFALVVLFYLSLLGCFSGSYKHKLEFNPSEPLRVAVLPFVQVDEEGNITQADAGLLVDQVPLLSSEVGETPANYVRKLVQNELNHSALDVLAPYLVDTELPHHGFGLPDGSFNYRKIYATPASQLCVHFLDCDAVLLGKITKWDRSYYGVQSVSTVGLEITLVAAVGERVLFTSTAEDFDSRGISKGPTGYTSAVLEPIKGLDSQIILDLSEKIVRKVVSPLKRKAKVQDSKTPPPSIYATSHDARDGKLLRSEPLILLMYGSAKAKASFSIGEFIRSVPMEEHSPGHYYGEYHPLPSDHFSNQEVTFSLEDSSGRLTSRVVSKEPLTLAIQK
jgi:hypothetical protein